jgi:S-adenosylmethionine-diacylglycerol 3-amino-3-carboxypropyl transferase
MFFGAYQPSCILPLHLQEQHYTSIQQNVHRITPKTVALDKVLKDSEVMQTVTAFSLSDFASYCTPSQYQHVWETLAQHALPNAKFCERFFLIQQQPEQFISRLQRHHELEQKLSSLDKTAIYSFCSGTL